MSKERIVKITLSAAVAVAILLPLPAFAGPHDKGCYACNATNGTKYYRCLKKRSDDQEKAFKQSVPGGCEGNVSYPVKAPVNGTSI